MQQLLVRVNELIDTCWSSFCAKVGGGLITINKEASMQLHFAYLLKNAADLFIHHQDEAITIELETGIAVNGRLREADIVLEITKGDTTVKLPIEMKCYKTKSSSGKGRGAQDIFKMNVYEDLELLESYVCADTLLGVQLTMTDYRGFVHPRAKKGKSWTYDTSHGTIIADSITLDTPIGGKPVLMNLRHKYAFNWIQNGSFYFLKIQGS
jgi:hypothetical protein